MENLKHNDYIEIVKGNLSRNGNRSYFLYQNGIKIKKFYVQSDINKHLNIFNLIYICELKASTLYKLKLKD